VSYRRLREIVLLRGFCPAAEAMMASCLYDISQAVIPHINPIPSSTYRGQLNKIKSEGNLFHRVVTAMLEPTPEEIKHIYKAAINWP